MKMRKRIVKVNLSQKLYMYIRLKKRLYIIHYREAKLFKRGA